VAALRSSPSRGVSRPGPFARGFFCLDGSWIGLTRPQTARRFRAEPALARTTEFVSCPIPTDHPRSAECRAPSVSADVVVIGRVVAIAWPECPGMRTSRPSGDCTDALEGARKNAGRSRASGRRRCTLGRTGDQIRRPTSGQQESGQVQVSDPSRSGGRPSGRPGRCSHSSRKACSGGRNDGRRAMTDRSDGCGRRCPPTRNRNDPWSAASNSARSSNKNPLLTERSRQR
jgi:hypothetical protein